MASILQEQNFWSDDEITDDESNNENRFNEAQFNRKLNARNREEDVIEEELRERQLRRHWAREETNPEGFCTASSTTFADEEIERDGVKGFFDKTSNFCLMHVKNHHPHDPLRDIGPEIFEGKTTGYDTEDCLTIIFKGEKEMSVAQLETLGHAIRKAAKAIKDWVAGGKKKDSKGEITIFIHEGLERINQFERRMTQDLVIHHVRTILKKDDEAWNEIPINVGFIRTGYARPTVGSLLSVAPSPQIQK